MTARLLDPKFKYTPAAAQSVLETWRKAGFKPTTQAERNARIRRQMSAATQAPAGNIGMSANLHRAEAPAVAAPTQINAAPQAPCTYDESNPSGLDASLGSAKAGKSFRAPHLGKAEYLVPVQPAVAAPTHTDHPLRHYDRTCPACIALNVRELKRRTK